MSNTSIEQSWFAAKGDNWAAFCLAMKDLDLTLEEVAPIEMQDRGTIRCGVYRHGWFSLFRPWELEPLIVQRLATRLGLPVDHITYQAWARRGSSAVEFVAEGTGQRVFPEGVRQPLRMPDEPFVSGDLGADAMADEQTQRDMLRSFAWEAAHEALSALLDPNAPTRSFRIRTPRGWQVPDRFTLAQRDGALSSRGALVLERDGQRFEPPKASLPMMLFRWTEGGALDSELPLPDLGRWTERLLRRHNLTEPPQPGTPAHAAYQTDWERLTRGDRAALGANGRVPRWKLVEQGVWELSAKECALLVERTGRPDDAEQRAWAALWTSFLGKASNGCTVRIG